jgi:hypothetical protein
VISHSHLDFPIALQMVSAAQGTGARQFPRPGCFPSTHTPGRSSPTPPCISSPGWASRRSPSPLDGRSPTCPHRWWCPHRTERKGFGGLLRKGPERYRAESDRSHRLSLLAFTELFTELFPRVHAQQSVRQSSLLERSPTEGKVPRFEQ